MARSCWGGKHNGEMKRLMLRHAFRFADRVWFRGAPINLRSQGAAEQIGAVRAGFRRDGAGRDSVMYQITAAMYGRKDQG